MRNLFDKLICKLTEATSKFEAIEVAAGGCLHFERISPKGRRHYFGAYINYPDYFGSYLDTDALKKQRGEPLGLVDVVKSGSRIRCTSSMDIIAAIKQHGISPADYAAREPVSLARALTWVEGELLIYIASPVSTILVETGCPSPIEYEPRWEPPYLIWHCFVLGQKTYGQQKTRIE